MNSKTLLQILKTGGRTWCRAADKSTTSLRMRLWQGCSRLLLPLLGALAFAWFLARVIPKPIRATYPCQRAAFPMATFCIVWLLGLKTGLVAWLRAKGRLGMLQPAFLPALVLGFALLGIYGTGRALDAIRPGYGPEYVWTPSDPPNSPMGEPKGLFPGRVVWVRDTNSTPYTGSGVWWAAGNPASQEAADRMLSASLRALAGTATDAEAWNSLFRSFNRTHGRGDTGYAAPETIAVKLNCNNNYSGYGDADNHIDASPQSVLALLRQLVQVAGVPQNRIVLYEAVRVIPDRIYNPCHLEFPDVLWLDSMGTGSNGRQKLVWRGSAFQYSDPDITSGTSLPEPVFQAAYVINMALLKGHWRAGVSLTSKNHIGSIQSPANAHPAIENWQTSMGRYNPLVDLIGSRHLGGKTMLFMIDGLYGTLEVQSYVTRTDAAWNTLFAGQWSASYFLSQDPLAIDSVGLDFLRCEFGDRLASGHNANADNYLHEAAQAPNSLSGITYRPDDIPLASLGVHEHWNNPTNKQYTGNLGNRGGIELVSLVRGVKPAVAIVAPGSASSCAEGSPLRVRAQVVEGEAPVRQVDFYAGTAFLGTAPAAPYEVVWPAPPGGVHTLTAVATDSLNRSTESAPVKIRVHPAGVAVAGTLYLDLRATNFNAGHWTNLGTLGNFSRAGGGTFVGDVRGTGIPGVEIAARADVLSGPASIPDFQALSDRSVEIWALNPEVDTEETLLSWGHRGTTGRNFALNYGSSPQTGAASLWGTAYDLGWADPPGVPVAAAWHHFVYTYDGSTNCRVYVDGKRVVSRSLPLYLNTFPNETLLLGAQRGTTSNSPPDNAWFTGYINNVRLHGGCLTEAEAAANYRAGPAVNTPPPQISACSLAGQTMFVTFATIPGRMYQLQFREILDRGDWEPVGTPQQAVSTQLTVEDPAPPAVPQRYYRVLFVP